jgi:hypothetical protein
MNLLLFQKKRLSKGISLALDFTSGVLDSRITFTRASSGTRVNSSGIIESVTSNLPRFDYDPVTLAPKGLLIEEQRTNLLTYSSEFDNAAWVKGAGVTVTTNAITAPDNTTTADKFNYSGAALTPSQTIASTTTTYTVSAYVKSSNTSFCRLRIAAVGGSATVSGPYFNIATGVVSSAGVATADFGSFLPSITSVGNGWYRISVTFTVLSVLTSITYGIVAAQTSDGASAAGDELYAWGAQLEAGAFPTSYIPTTSATVTRAADNASMVGSNFSSWYNQSEGTVYCASDSPLATTTAQMNWYISDSTGINIIFNRKNVLNLCAASVVVGGVPQADITSFSTITAYSTVKSAFAYKLNDVAISVNGASVGTDLAATIPTVDRIHLGQNVYNGQILNGHIQFIKYYPKRLPNADLQRLTR